MVHGQSGSNSTRRDPTLTSGSLTIRELAPIRGPGVQGNVSPIAAEAPAELDCLRSAMTSTLQHAQISAPRTDRVTILVGHHAGQLMHMSEVVNGPCRQKLR